MQNSIYGMNEVNDRNDDRKSCWKETLFYIFVVLALVTGLAMVLFWCPITSFLKLPQLCTSSYKVPKITTVNPILIRTTTTSTTARPRIGGSTMPPEVNASTPSIKTTSKLPPTSTPPNTSNSSTTSTPATSTTTTSKPSTTIPTDNYAGFNFTTEIVGDLFKTSENCNFPSYQIVELFNVTSLRSCGEACVANPNCNRFSFAKICFLTKWPDSNPPPVRDYVLVYNNNKNYTFSCGFVIGRKTNTSQVETTTTTERVNASTTTTPKPSTGSTTTIPTDINYAGFNFTIQTAGDLFKTSENCNFPFYDIGNVTNSTVRSCGEACVANPNCNFFSFVSKFCYLKKRPDINPPPVRDGDTVNYQFYCGYVIGRTPNTKSKSETAQSRYQQKQRSDDRIWRTVDVNY